MKKGDLNTVQTNDITIASVEVDETALSNGFDNPLLFGSFKLARKTPNIRNGA